MSDSSPARILSQEILSDGWGRLTRYTIDYTRRDGHHETQVREVYDRGNAACVLPIDRERGSVLLVRQFRLPVQLQGGDGYLIEACAGLNDDLSPEATIHKEAEEELGYRVHELRRVLDVYMSPGSVSERISLFMAAYTPAGSCLRRRRCQSGGRGHRGARNAARPGARHDRGRADH